MVKGSHIRGLPPNRACHPLLKQTKRFWLKDCHFLGPFPSIISPRAGCLLRTIFEPGSQDFVRFTIFQQLVDKSKIALNL